MTSRKQTSYWSESGLDGIFGARAVWLWLAFGIGGAAIGAGLAGGLIGYESFLRDGYPVCSVRMVFSTPCHTNTRSAFLPSLRKPETGMRGF